MEKERNSHRPWKEAQNSPPKKIEKNLMNLEEEEKKSKRIQVKKKSETQRRIRTDFSRHGRYRTSGARHRKMGSGEKKKEPKFQKKIEKKRNQTPKTTFRSIPVNPFVLDEWKLDLNEKDLPILWCYVTELFYRGKGAAIFDTPFDKRRPIGSLLLEPPPPPRIHRDFHKGERIRDSVGH